MISSKREFAGVVLVPVINFTSKRVITRGIGAIAADIRRFSWIYT